MSGGQRFSGKVALITGGGTGIGAATAERIVGEGGQAVIMGRREAPLQSVAGAIGCEYVVGDTASQADLENAVGQVVERFGGLDVLVANAGVETFGSVETVPLEDWRRTFEINLEGAMLASRAAIPATCAQWVVVRPLQGIPFRSGSALAASRR